MEHYLCRTCGLLCSEQNVCWNLRCCERGAVLVGCNCQSPEHADPQPRPSLPLIELLSLKYDLARHVSIAGMDPLQFKSFMKIPGEDLKRIRLDYAQFLGEHRYVLGKWSSRYWSAATLAAFAGWLILRDRNEWIGFVLFAVWVIGGIVTSKRKGKTEGYLEGYEEGHGAGICKALGVSEDDARFYYEAAMDMEIQDRRPWPERKVGDAEAQSSLGAKYASGQGVPQNYVLAVYWYREAAEQGFADAQLNLGHAYHYGKGVPQDFAQAAFWWRKAAEQGSARAQHSLGVIYDHGHGVPQDYTQASAWYRKAAEQGYADAQFNLGITYCYGYGLPQNYGEAYFWFSLAASGQETDNSLEKAANFRQHAASHLTPADLTRVQERARQWSEARPATKASTQ